MTNEELEREAEERARDFTDNKERQVAYECGFLDGADRATEELKEDNKVMSDNYSQMEQKFFDNLSQTKELLRELYVIVKVGCSPFFKDEHKTFLMEIKEFLQEE